jgi:hypothetical protein
LRSSVLIENGLKEANVSISGYNNTIVESIQSNAANQGNKTGDLAVAKAAENIRKYTNGLITDLEDLKNELGEASAGSNNPEEYYTRANLKKYEPQSNVMINKKKADDLQKWLDDYPAQVNAAINALGKPVMDEEWSASLAIKAEDISYYADNSKRYKDALKEDYAHFNFYKAPLASVLAQLTFYQNQLYSKESEALNYVADLIGSGVTVGPDAVPDLGGLAPVQPTANQEDEQPNEEVASNTGTTTAQPNTSTSAGPSEIPEADMLERTVQGIDYAQAVVLAKSNTVTAGLPFEAEAFLTFGNTALTPTVKRNGQEQEVINGRGVIKFDATAAASEYDKDNLAKKSFDLEIVMDDGSGGQITRKKKHEYFVARPVIAVASKAIEALYRDCANPVTVEVPSLGAAYSPTFQMTGGTFAVGSGKGEINISPTANEASIDVYSSGLYIGKKTFLYVQHRFQKWRSWLTVHLMM